MISDVVPPANRTFANSFNNLTYFFAGLLVTIVNAFVLPYIPGAFSATDNYQTYRTSMLVSTISFLIGCVCAFFVKETCPNVLLRRECKKIGVEYKPEKKETISTKEAFKIIFKNANLTLIFCAYIIGFGNSVLNMNVASVFISKFM